MPSKKECRKQQGDTIYDQEQRKNAAGNFNDNFNRTQAGMPNTTGMSAKEIGVIILIILVIFTGYSIYRLV